MTGIKAYTKQETIKTNTERQGQNGTRRKIKKNKM
jgi:hypothetical protein